MLNHFSKFLFILIIVFSILLLSNALADDHDDFIGFITDGTCGENITWKLDELGNLYITGAGNMPDYSIDNGIYPPWFGWYDEIKFVSISSGITSIGDCAFEYCDRLLEITLPEGITSIGSFSFFACRNLSKITLPESTTTIGEQAFRGCEKLQSINIPEKVTSIEIAAFAGCSNLNAVYAANIESWLKISFAELGNPLAAGYGTLYFQNQPVISLIIPDGTTTILKNAFKGCKSLTSVSIPNSVSSIGDGAFSFCSNLTSINIPDSVSSISDAVFSGCSSLTSINIPDSIVSIGSNAFSGCSKFTNLEIPDNVTFIGGHAFYNCSQLTSITLPCGITSVEPGTFRACSNLVDVFIPSHVTSIGINAFRDCCNLSSIVIPQGITSIQSHTFTGCTSLKKLVLPRSVYDIRSSAFENCPNLTLYVHKDSPAFIWCLTSGISFEEIGKTDNTLTLPTSLIAIKAEAFKDSSIEDVVIPSTVKSIGSQAFANCDSLFAVTLPDDVQIAPDAFSGSSHVFFICDENSPGHTFAQTHNIPWIIQ